MRKCNLTMRNAIEAQCHECMGYYSDGKQDCENTKCSLYTWMPYRKKSPGEEWRTRYFRRQGIVQRKEPTAEQLEKMEMVRSQKYSRESD